MLRKISNSGFLCPKDGGGQVGFSVGVCVIVVITIFLDSVCGILPNLHGYLL